MESPHDTDDDVLRARLKLSTLVVIAAMLFAGSLYVMAFVRVPFDKVYFECASVVCFLAAAILTPISAIAALSNVELVPAWQWRLEFIAALGVAGLLVGIMAMFF